MRFLGCCLLIFSPFLISHTYAQGHDGLTIGFIPIGCESGEWCTAMYENVKEEAQRRGIGLKYYDGSTRESHFYGFGSFIEQRVDAILVEPVMPTGWEQLLQEAQDAGIPVVILNRSIAADESLYLTRVSLDFGHQGRLAAAWLAQATGGSCTIVELEGTEGSEAALERQAGFNAVIALFPHMTITTSQYGDFSRAGGKAAMETILSTINPAEICAVWAHNDAMALGAIEVLKDAGLDPGEDILMVSIDAITDMQKAIAEGDANMSVETSPFLAGPAFDAIANYFAGELVPKQILIQGGMVSQDTVAGRTVHVVVNTEGVNLKALLSEANYDNQEEE